ncbi:MAG: HTH domain-containing protein [Planctomycetota bacterium]
MRKRTDSERRVRQCARLSRLLRVLRLILGPGRWDAEALARELECSSRTIQRDLQVLSMSGVPWYFDTDSQAYRVPAGFRFAPLPLTPASEQDPILLLAHGKKLIEDTEQFLDTLRQLVTRLEQHNLPSSPLSPTDP